jgi:hypothetical protein
MPQRLVPIPDVPRFDIRHDDAVTVVTRVVEAIRTEKLVDVKARERPARRVAARDMQLAGSPGPP